MNFATFINACEYVRRSEIFFLYKYYRVRLNSLQQYPVAYSSMPKFFIEAPREMHMKLLADSESESSFFVKGYFKESKLIGIIGMLPETRECVDHKASMWGFYVDPDYQGQDFIPGPLCILNFFYF